MKHVLIYISALFISFNILAQNPKREMRAVWITTVANIDFPKNPTSSTSNQKQEIITMLDTHKQHGINTIYFQVRPTSDAFYYSKLEPWSKYLTGNQGEAPKPYYDPLAFIIKEAHKRNMELHAWINPFRVRLNANDPLTNDHPYIKNPDWGWDYNNKTYYDPGIPAVRKHTRRVVIDIVKRYDVDGIHFDDYFYPYRNGNKEALPDHNTFKKYKNKFTGQDIGDWRRHNINVFIKSVARDIKREKAWVKFGVSPFGIWKNSTSPNDDLPTKYGSSNYDMLYADVIRWVREGWVDYCTPQLYWAIGYEHADFSKLITWWDKHSYGRHMYVGHSLYKVDINSKEEAWRSTSEIEKQITEVRNKKNIHGSAFYSSKHLTCRNELQPLCDSLKNNYYKDYCLLPQMPWIDNQAPKPPSHPKVKKSNASHQLTWEAPKYKDEMDKAFFYVIYKQKGKEKAHLQADNIVSITRNTNYTLPQNSNGGVFYITALDRLHNESLPLVISIKPKPLLTEVFNSGNYWSDLIN